MEQGANDWSQGLGELDIPAVAVDWETVTEPPPDLEINADSTRLDAEETIGNPPTVERSATDATDETDVMDTTNRNRT